MTFTVKLKKKLLQSLTFPKNENKKIKLQKKKNENKK
jgi:hypothetical protein